MPPDTDRFRCIGLAYRAIAMGGIAPTVLNAADEIAVEAFLTGKIGFLEIPKVIEATLDASHVRSDPSLDEVLAADLWAKEFAFGRVSHARIGAI
jgi:1-deoxy-D-xylulose-5-phosphate reductoisomerase